jgi:SAM-dependent methyltransferase
MIKKITQQIRRAFLIFQDFDRIERSYAVLSNELTALREEVLQNELHSLRVGFTEQTTQLQKALGDLALAHHHTRVELNKISGLPGLNLPETLLVVVDRYDTLKAADVDSLEAEYATFEKYFYDTDRITEIQKIYLPLIPSTSKRRALDLGCGRGEFLVLLQEFGWIAKGVDENSAQCALAAAKNLDVQQGDMFSKLAQTTGESVDLVTALQVVEHIQPSQIRLLVTEGFRVLSSGGMVILETVNPLSPCSLANFWVDETHVRLVSSQWLEYVLASAGFRNIKTLFQIPVPREWQTANTLSNYANYAVIATKP